MKKIMYIMSLLLVVILGFSACATSKSLSSDITASYKAFLKENNDCLNASVLASDLLQSDYNDHYENVTLTNALFLAQNSNLIMEKLKSYLENEDFSKNLSKKNLKALKSSLEEYYQYFSSFSKNLQILEKTINNGGRNLKTDYQKLNESIGSVVLSGYNFSSKLIELISTKAPIAFNVDQKSVQAGSINLFVLDCYNNILNTYANIYLKNHTFDAKYALDELELENPDSNIVSLTKLIKENPGSLFDLTDENFKNINSTLLVLQSQNNSIKSKLDTIEKLSNDLISNLNGKGSEKTDLTETAKAQIKSYLTSTITTELYPQIRLLISLIHTIKLA